MVNRSRARLVFLTTAAIGFAMCQAPATAQDSSETVAPPVAEPDSEGGLTEIVVTARKREESLQEVPIAVTAFTGASLEAQNGTNIEDLGGLVPNLVIEEGFGNTGNAIIFIRGIGVQENERFLDPAVGVVLDGVFLGNSRGALVNTFDFERVEVLRGPQGTLFGKNTTGGVINIRRNRPQFEFGGRAEITVGSFDRFDLNGVLNVPISGDRLAARVSAARYRNDYYVRSLQRDRRVKGDDIVDIVASLRFRPTDSFDALLTYQYQKDESLTPSTINLSGTGAGNPVNPGGEIVCTLLTFCAPFDGGDTFGGTASFNDNEQHNVTLEINWETGLGNFTSVSGYREATDRQQSDTDSVPVDVFGVERDYDFQQLSQEIRLDSRVSDRLQLTTGVFVFADDIELRQDIVDLLAFFGAPPGSEIQLRNRQKRFSAAGFAQADFTLNDQLSFTLGGRYSYERKRFRAAGANFINGLGTVPVASARDRETWNSFTPRVGVNWQVRDEVLLYYTFGRGFRSGGYNGRAFTPAAIGPYDQESVTQHEVGVKSELFDRSLRVNLAAFHYKYDDKQEEVIQADPIQGTATVTTNASNATIKGIEAEFLWAPVTGLEISGNVGYLDAAYDDFCADLDGPFVAATGTACGPTVPVPNGALTPVDNSQLRLRRAPEWQYGVNARYSSDVGPGVLGGQVTWNWTDEYFQDLRNDPRSLYRSEGKLDASLSFTLKDDDDRALTLTVFGRNLTDEQQFTGVAVAPPFVAIGIRTEPRTYGVSLSGRF